MGLALIEGSTDNFTKMLQSVDESKIIISKFKENFFIRDLMQEAKEKKQE